MKFSIRNIRITPRLILIFSLVAALPLIVVGTISGLSWKRSVKITAQESVLMKNNDIKLNLEYTVNNALRDVHTIEQLPPIQGIILAMRNNNLDTTSNTTLDQWSERLYKAFEANIAHKQEFVSISYCDATGKTLLKVKNVNSQPVRATINELISIKATAYFSKAVRKFEDETYVSDLIVEETGTSVAYHLICAMPVYEKQTKNLFGVIVLELNLNKVINQINNLVGDKTNINILNQDEEVIYRTGNLSLNGEQAIVYDTEKYVSDNQYAISVLNVDFGYGSTTTWKVLFLEKVKEINLSDNQFIRYLILWSLILFSISVLIGYLISKTIVNNVVLVRDALVVLGKGMHPSTIYSKMKDELGEMIEALNALVGRLRQTAEFAKKIGEGNLDVDFKPLGDEDILGNALLDMRNNLHKVSDEEALRAADIEKQNWNNKGIARFSEILRQNTSSIKKLSKLVISNLVDYLHANQGALFIINNLNNEDIYIEQVATIAYNRQRAVKKRLELNEGLIGRCIDEQLPIFMTNLPDKYIEITSGLGGTQPSCLLIVPLKTNNNVYGALELASFTQFSQYEIDFVNKISESIASSIASVKIGEHTTALLNQMQEQSDILASQEEEMRQNLEELQATQEESARREAEIRSVLDTINSTALMVQLSVEGAVIEINQKFLELLDKSLHEVVGYLWTDILAQPEYDSLIHTILDDVRKGKTHKEIFKITLAEKNIWFSQTFSPIKDTDDDVIKILSIATDITASMSLQQELIDKTNRLQQQELELRNNSAQLLASEEAAKAKIMLVEELKNQEIETIIGEAQKRENDYKLIISKLEKYIGTDTEAD